MKPLTDQRSAVFIGLTSFALGWIFDYFFYLKAPGISVLLYTLLIILGLWILAVSFNKPLPKGLIWLILPLIFFTSMLAIRSSAILSFFNILASLVLLLLILASAHGRDLKKYLFSHYLRLFILPIDLLVPATTTLRQLVTARRQDSGNQTIKAILRGTIITLPILVVFLWLFASADLVFEKYLTQLFSFNLKLDPMFMFRTGLVLVISLGFIGAYTYFFSPGSTDQSKPARRPSFLLGHIESSILLGSLNALFLVFILLQLTYLFGGEANIAAQGFTYAEYARKGFFELVGVAVAAFLLLWHTEKRISKNDSISSPPFKLLSGLLIIQVLIIMVSAFQRLSLYEQAYGFTTLRFYSHAFIIWLAIVFIFLLYKITLDRSSESLVHHTALSALLLLALINLSNPDAFIARQNLERYDTTGKLDTNYLASLSDDALPESIKALDLPDEDLRRNFARDLYWQLWIHRDSSLYRQWPSTNLSRQAAADLLEAKAPQLEENKDYRPLKLQKLD